jgi:hypothetical protein
MPRKSKNGNRVYWPRELDQYIEDYNKSTDSDEREMIFREHLDYPLDKMAENIINRFKFPYIGGSFDETKKQVVSFLVINLSKYDQSKGHKSFSYFSVIAKNYLILHNNNGYKQEKRSVYLSDAQSENYVPLEEMIDLQTPNLDEQEDFREFTKLMVKYWDNNLTRIFKKKRDIDIATAIIELFRQAEKIENFNKKALYLMIREMTDCKTSYITKVVNKMREHVMKQLDDYRAEGRIGDNEDKFFTYR